MIELKFFPKFELKTKFETMLQLTSFNSGGCFKKDCSRKQKNVPKNKVDCLRTNKFSFLCLGTSKTLSFGEFDES